MYDIEYLKRRLNEITDNSRNIKKDIVVEKLEGTYSGEIILVRWEDAGFGKKVPMHYIDIQEILVAIESIYDGINRSDAYGKEEKEVSERMYRVISENFLRIHEDLNRDSLYFMCSHLFNVPCSVCLYRSYSIRFLEILRKNILNPESEHEDSILNIISEYISVVNRHVKTVYNIYFPAITNSELKILYTGSKNFNEIIKHIKTHIEESGVSVEDIYGFKILFENGIVKGVSSLPFESLQVKSMSIDKFVIFLEARYGRYLKKINEKLMFLLSDLPSEIGEVMSLMES